MVSSLKTLTICPGQDPQISAQKPYLQCLLCAPKFVECYLRCQSVCKYWAVGIEKLLQLPKQLVGCTYPTNIIFIINFRIFIRIRIELHPCRKLCVCTHWWRGVYKFLCSWLTSLPKKHRCKWYPRFYGYQEKTQVINVQPYGYSCISMLHKYVAYGGCCLHCPVCFVVLMLSHRTWVWRKPPKLPKCFWVTGSFCQELPLERQLTHPKSQVQYTISYLCIFRAFVFYGKRW